MPQGVADQLWQALRSETGQMQSMMELLRAVQAGGVARHLRPEVWPLLLGCIAPEDSYEVQVSGWVVVVLGLLLGMLLRCCCWGCCWGCWLLQGLCGAAGGLRWLGMLLGLQSCCSCWWACLLALPGTAADRHLLPP